ncbi:MAG: protein kinase [Burkholderiales bacterium]|nr:protein kinase [Burkholderiales bacterium]
MMDNFGKYELKGQLGKGSTGIVYRAVDTFSGIDVAVKVIDANVFQDPQFGTVLRKQFLKEASLAGKLNHPHIASILDAVVTDNAGYIVMEYVPGVNLCSYAEADPLLSVEDTVQIGFKCCGALDYAFRQSIIHRDIKPANIMTTDGRDVKILDFGAAFLQNRDATQPINIGSPAYMSPEQISAMPLTQATDMYCLGVVLYELLTGKRPFAADSITALIQQILHDEPLPMSQLNPSIPGELDRIVLKMLQKKPEDRYPNWANPALELAEIGRLSAHQRTIPDSERYAALKRVRMLSTLSEAEIWELVDAGRWTRLHARTEIVRESDPGRSMFFLAQGDVKVTQAGRLLNVIGAGEFFGEMGYICDGDLPRQATVESMTEVIIAEFEATALDRMSTPCHSSFMRALVRNLADRLALADLRITNQTI